MPASAKASEAPNPAFGDPSPTPFAFFDPSSCSWRTSPPCCAAGSTSSTPIWPRSGTTRAGSAYAHPTSGLHTAVTGCSCWPPDETTCSASTATTPAVTEPVVTLPTPCARDGKGPGMQRGLPDLVERRPLGPGRRSGQPLQTPPPAPTDPTSPCRPVPWYDPAWRASPLGGCCPPRAPATHAARPTTVGAGPISGRWCGCCPHRRPRTGRRAAPRSAGRRVT